MPSQPTPSSSFAAVFRAQLVFVPLGVRGLFRRHRRYLAAGTAVALGLMSSCNDAQPPVAEDDTALSDSSSAGNNDDEGGTGETDGFPDDVSVPACSTDLAAHLSGVGVPGLAAAVVADGRLVCTAVAGMADIERSQLVEPTTVWEWASVSKVVVAAAVMQLVDEGRIGLDDDASEHLPFELRNPMCAGAPITIRQLMTHTSSIIDNETVYDDTYTAGDSPVELGDFLGDYLVPGGAHYDAGDNFDHECPGQYNEYSNIAAGGVLGHIVEHVSGQAFDAFCRARIFEPLHMQATSFRLADLDIDQVARPYRVDSGAFTPIDHPGYATYPDGLLRTSVVDLARFLAMMGQSGVYEGTRLLSEATVEEMIRPQIPDLDQTQGLIVYYDFDQSLVGHDGEDDGASSLMFYDPRDGTGALLVGNASWWEHDGGAPAANALFEALIAEAKHRR